MCLYFLVLLCSVVTYFGFKSYANYHSLTESQLNFMNFESISTTLVQIKGTELTTIRQSKKGMALKLVALSISLLTDFSLVCLFLLVAWDSTCVTWMGCTDSPAPIGWQSHTQHHRKDAHVPANPHVWRRYQEMSCYATRAGQGCRRAWTQQCVCVVCMFLTRVSEWDSMRGLGIEDSVAILTRWVTNIDRRAFCLAITLIICVFFFFFRALALMHAMHNHNRRRIVHSQRSVTTVIKVKNIFLRLRKQSGK